MCSIVAHAPTHARAHVRAGVAAYMTSLAKRFFESLDVCAGYLEYMRKCDLREEREPRTPLLLSFGEEWNEKELELERTSKAHQAAMRALLQGSQAEAEAD